MKIFFFMGRNPSNQSGVSWKIWKIARTGKTVSVLWGPVRLRNRKVLPSGMLQSKELHFASAAAAANYEASRIQRKLSKGYERKPRRRVG